MSRVINRKHITINTILVANTPFFFDMKLQFQPDEMIVRAISCCGDRANPSNGVASILCDSINESLGSFVDISTSNPNLIFNASNFPINTSWRLRAIDPTTGAGSTFTSEISIQLEFVKYA